MLNGVSAQVKATSPEVTSLPPTHILVVDDDPSVRQMIVDYLGEKIAELLRIFYRIAEKRF